ncbi:Sec61beta family-domain-containing protein [Pelagophyceae sp. CCMP2097]|nr:Sec61beta family-domain-containing protein [Pelagophyceae sp. CCMP2097]
MSTPTEGAPKGPLSRPAPARGPGGGVLAQRKRPARTSSGGAGNAQAMQRAQPGILRFYADEAQGLKIGPTSVLVMSLMFIGFVVVLHIFGKIAA